jgi:hypothetical protein
VIDGSHGELAGVPRCGQAPFRLPAPNLQRLETVTAPRIEPLEPPDAGGEAAWALVQVSALARRAKKAADQLLVRVGDMDVHLLDDECIQLTREATTDVVTAAHHLNELTARMDRLAGQLPEELAAVGYERIALAAAHDLAEGNADETTLSLAAGILHYRVGWRALALGLRDGDPRARWTGTLRGILGSFRDAPGKTDALASLGSGIELDADFRTLERGRVEQIVGVLARA